MSVTVRAPAKINLHLGVGPLREDGFHDLVTVYQAIGLYDDLTATDADAWGVAVEPTGDVDCSEVPLDARNLAVRAGLLLADHHGLARAAHLHVRKGIPVAGGLAGGSADAAAALVALDRLWDAHTPDHELLELAGRLGSDVPFALLGGTAYGRGHGELVEPVPDAGDRWWVVVPSGEGLPTPSVYAEFDRLGAPGLLDAGAVVQGVQDPRPEALATGLHNDLEPPALSLRPDLARVADLLRGAGVVQPLLSGSGPTWLGLVRDMRHGHDVVSLLREELPHVLLAPAPVAGAHVVEYA